MAVPPNSQRLSLPVAPLVAGVIGILTAIMFALVPTELLESMVVDSGIASVLSAAEPPLGFTARAALVLVCGGGVGLIAWFSLFLVFGSRMIVVQRAVREGEAAPVLRRADAHPDAPARRPLFANTDLGTPFLEVRARPLHVDADVIAAAPVVEVTPAPPERALPADLDQPLSAYDPAAVPDAPIDWSPTASQPEPARPEPAQPAPMGAVTVDPAPVVPVPMGSAPTEPASVKPLPVEPETVKPAPLPRRQTFEAGERFETFPLTPMVRPTDPEAQPLPIRQAPRGDDPAETIQALLDRLERVVSRRDRALPPAPRPETIEDTLTSLRGLATGGQ